MLDVSDKQDHWRVIHIAEGPVANAQPTYVEQWRKRYSTFGDIPKKTQTAVAVLAMGADTERIAGYGQKVSDTNYWVDDTPEILEEYK